MADLVVTQVRSSIGAKPKHRGTLRALGLGRIGKSNTLPDRPEIRGMIAKVPHMITVDEEAEARPQKAPATKAPAKAAEPEKATAKKTATPEKATAKKTAAKKAAAKKTAAPDKATAKKTAAKKAAAKKTPAKRAAAKTSTSEETREG
jgi:large subunit ribosomal protein L30